MRSFKGLTPYLILIKLESELVGKPFKQLHLDLIGLIKPESSLKHCYILTVVNNHSGYLAGFPPIRKDDTTDTLINLLESDNARRGYYPLMICSDGGGELISEPYHPEHNGRAERANQTIIKSIRVTINCLKIPKRFWHKILKSFCLGLSLIPKKGQDISPWEDFSFRFYTTCWDSHRDP
ncbi:hypothetical protein VP01_463g8 [Puccinia sorghi]|uniref:Integrase catalytic domain-containing protein n=1 Tax=Puccinia sorghi TaxID=27349 RepID=A0A0L6UQA6_9BASI|nr:hypothetical protein VP01_463g8 [Puccinia sorghi]